MKLNIEKVKIGSLLYAEDLMFYNPTTEIWDCGQLVEITEIGNSYIRGDLILEMEDNKKMAIDTICIEKNDFKLFEVL